MAFQWWWVPAGLFAVALLLLLKPARGPLWPFLLFLPIAAITALFAFAALANDFGLGAYLHEDRVLQILLAVRFVAALLMIGTAAGRRIFATVLAVSALLADPLLYDYFVCPYAAGLCR